MWYNILRQTTSSYIKNRIKERSRRMYEHIFDQEVQKKMDDFFLKNLASHGKLINFKKGEIIKQEDFESIYILLEGELNQIMHSKEGDEIIFFRVVKGNIFGEMAFFDQTNTFAVNKAVTKGSISVVNRRFVESKLREDPQIYHYFLISIILTHEEIANRLGLNRITVTNTMNQFRDRGLIDIENRKIIIKDIDTLRKMTNILV